MPRFSRLWIGLLLFAVVLSDVVAEDAERVGRFGDLAGLQITGLASFTADQLRDELRRDFDVQLATHPLAPWNELPAIVRERLLAGLLNEGFADAEVEVHWDSERKRLRATVREGPRYVAGNVRVMGAAKLNARRLLERLTKPYAPREAVKLAFGPRGTDRVQWRDRDGKNVELKSPVWQAGSPAKLASVSKQWMERKVKLALEDIGFRFASFRIDLESHRETQTVDLVVSIESEGPEACIDEIEIIGDQRNSEDAILKYLNLQQGMLLTRAEQARIGYELWRSGRFIDFDVVPVPPSTIDEPMKLRVKVTESSFAPPMDQPPSREERALLRMQEWLANPDRWQADLVVQSKIRAGALEFVFAPGHGVLATVSPESDPLSRTIAVVVSKDLVGYYPANASAKLEVRAPQAELGVRISLQLNADPEDPARPFKLNLMFPFHSKRASDSECPFAGSITIQPAAAVAMAHVRDPEVRWDDAMLTLSSDRRRMQVDEATGALESFHQEDDQIDITFVKQSFDRCQQQIQKRASGLDNMFDAARPMTSILAFFCREDVIFELADVVAARSADSKASGEQTENLTSQLKTLTFVRKLLDAGALKPIDDWCTKPKRNTEATFEIPESLGPDAKPPNFVAIIARGAVTIADDLFPSHSWLWTVWREVAFTLAGKGKYTGPQLQAFYESHDFGPVCYLVLSVLLERVQPRMVPPFASRGLRSTDTEDFRNDYEPLLDRRFVIGACLHRASEVLRELEDDEIQDISDRLPDAYSPCFQAFVRELQRNDRRTTEQALPAALDRCWNAGLQQLIESQLRRLRDRNSVRLGLL